MLLIWRKVTLGYGNIRVRGCERQKRSYEDTEGPRRGNHGGIGMKGVADHSRESTDLSFRGCVSEGHARVSVSPISSRPGLVSP